MLGTSSSSTLPSSRPVTLEDPEGGRREGPRDGSGSRYERSVLPWWMRVGTYVGDVRDQRSRLREDC